MSSFVSPGFGSAATSAAERGGGDSAHEHDVTNLLNIGDPDEVAPAPRGREERASAATHRGEELLFVPVCTEMSVGAVAA